MTHTNFTAALIRMSRHRLGIAEACALFCLADGATANQVAEQTDSDIRVVRARLVHLRRKRLVKSARLNDGSCIYKPTATGAALIRKTLNLKTTASTPEA